MFKKVFFFIILFILPLTVLGAEYHSNEQIIIASDKIIDTNYYALAKSISVYGEIEGDIFIMADTVLIDSENIKGDLFIIAKDITIQGRVEGNLRIFGDKLNIAGKIEKNTLFIGGLFNLLKEGKLNGNLTNFLSRSSLEGEVNGKVDGYLESLFIKGSINNDLDINFFKSINKDINLNIGPEAIITGTLKYKALEEAQIEEGAEINKTEYLKDSFSKQPLFTIDNLWKFVIQFFALMIVGMILLHLFPNLFKDINRELFKHPFSNISKGLLLFILIPTVSLVLMFTIIGIPLAIIILLLYGIFIYLSKLFIASSYFYLLKIKFFPEKRITDNNKLALGIFIYLIVSSIPILGPVITIYFFLLTWSLFFTKVFNKLKR